MRRQKITQARSPVSAPLGRAGPTSPLQAPFVMAAGRPERHNPLTAHVQIRTPTQRVVDRPDDMTRYLWEEALKALEEKYVDAKERCRKVARDLENIEAYIAHIQNYINRIKNSLDV
jgi:hypothetical protein